MLPILFVIFQTGSNANGGVESITQIIEHSPQLRPTIVTQIATPVNDRWAEAGAEVQVWPLPYAIGSAFSGGSIWQRWRRLWSLVATNLRMFGLVRRSGCRVVHHNDPSAFWHTALGAKLAGARVVFNIRDTKPADDRYGLKWQLAGRLGDRILVLSQAMGQSILARLAAVQSSPEKVQAIYSIVDPARFYPLEAGARSQRRQQLGIAPDTLALGYVATFNPKKAQLALIEQAAPALQQAIPNLRIYFIGDCDGAQNPYAQHCLEAAQRLGLTNLDFVGYTPAVADWYPALDLVALASRQEGLARCMIESLACGTPVVSFDVCSAAEILTGYDCGRVVAQGDYGGLVAAIAALACDRDLRRRLGQNGVQMARALFQPEAIAAQYAAVYRELAQPSLPRAIVDGCGSPSGLSRFLP
ncbi:glycosyltransferase family 4 protein [Nodosilinea sp. PGN35]|uniref:glycosyltransferase family 4 protein n=1 Tax=Nodosilinea sp. PGN35 TaxID=3020489 RepID=UPI0023B2BE9C|nr:glycosyltransferase family 4 protein [Nodosilinea sp. TSF1-S3]MDF0367108.1 glycosyltransferase family 4 protein [Nodosilinea sp. TSF1-S3]